MTDSSFSKDLSDYQNSNFDFGFTAMTETELSGKVAIVSPVIPPTVIDDTVKTSITNINNKINEITTKISALQVADKKSDMLRVEDKLDKLLIAQNLELATGFKQTEDNMRTIIDEVEERKGEISSVYKEKMIEVEALVLPLLYNLMKNPTKEYIHWPNRVEKINLQISKIIDITRSELQI